MNIELNIVIFFFVLFLNNDFLSFSVSPVFPFAFSQRHGNISRSDPFQRHAGPAAL